MPGNMGQRIYSGQIKFYKKEDLKKELKEL